MEQEERKAYLQRIAEAEMLAKRAIADKEEALRELRKYEAKIREAEKASRMKSLFLANMSHEIRTPLNAIEGFSRIIAETESLEERMQFLEIIETNNSRLGYLINEILDLSRIEAGEIAIRKAPTDLNKMCESIKQIFKFKLKDNVKLTEDVPERAVMLNTDGNRLIQVFSNLISNALKHTDRGSVTFGYRPVNDHHDIEFYVKDTGTGIAPEDIERIFHTYVSKDAESQTNSFGLGLSLSNILVEKLGGKISVRSQLGQGATFFWTLPLDGYFIHGRKEPQVTTLTKTLRMDANGGTNKMKLILIAEDEDSNYELLRNVLSKRYRLLRAKNGIEAVTLNEEEKPALILMDIRMPDMNGLDATRIIKEVNSDTPVIALSAYAYDEYIKEALAAGCDRFIAKPICIETLINTIKEYLKE